MEQKHPNILIAVIEEMLRLQSRFETLFAHVYSGSGLSTLQKLVLAAVLDARMPPTVPQIGRNLGCHRQVIQRTVNELTEQGLVERRLNPHHKRASLLVPTETALQMKREAERQADETAESFLGTISAARCDALAAELRALRLAIEAYNRAEGQDASALGGELSTASLIAMLQ